MSFGHRFLHFLAKIFDTRSQKFGAESKNRNIIAQVHEAPGAAQQLQIFEEQIRLASARISTQQNWDTHSNEVGVFALRADLRYSLSACNKAHDL